MKTTPPDLVHENGPLRIRYLAGSGQTLVVSFSGVGTRRAEEPPIEFPGIASERGTNHVLFVTDQSRSWLNGPDMMAEIARVIESTAEVVGATRIVGLGNSMGGTMALLLSNTTHFDAVIALTPQVSVCPAIVPEEDRWRYFRKRIDTFRYPRIDHFRADATRYYILHGDEQRELAHALRFPRVQGVSHWILPDCDHQLAAHLKRHDLLAPLIQDAIRGTYRRLRRRVSALRGIPLSRLQDIYGMGEQRAA